MLYMIVEHFRNQDPVPVYQRFRERELQAAALATELVEARLQALADAGVPAVR